MNTMSMSTMSTAAVLNEAMAKVYGMMGLGMLLTALVAMFTANSPVLLEAIFGSWLKWPVMLAPIGFVLAMSFGYQKFSATTLKALFFLYAAINGLSFAVILLAYTATSIAGAFFSSAALFGVMSGWGYFTKTDLTSWGKLLFLGVIGIIIAMIVNLFIGSTALAMTISCVAVLVFLGLTAYDTQKIRESLWDTPDDSKIVTMGALTLYLDFINLFVHLLQLIGVKKD